MGDSPKYFIPLSLRPGYISGRSSESGSVGSDGTRSRSQESVGSRKKKVTWANNESESLSEQLVRELKEYQCSKADSEMRGIYRLFIKMEKLIDGDRSLRMESLLEGLVEEAKKEADTQSVISSNGSANEIKSKAKPHKGIQEQFHRVAKYPFASLKDIVNNLEAPLMKNTISVNALEQCHQIAQKIYQALNSNTGKVSEILFDLESSVKDKSLINKTTNRDSMKKFVNEYNDLKRKIDNFSFRCRVKSQLRQLEAQYRLPNRDKQAALQEIAKNLFHIENKVKKYTIEINAIKYDINKTIGKQSQNVNCDYEKQLDYQKEIDFLEKERSRFGNLKVNFEKLKEANDTLKSTSKEMNKSRGLQNLENLQRGLEAVVENVSHLAVEVEQEIVSKCDKIDKSLDDIERESDHLFDKIRNETEIDELLYIFRTVGLHKKAISKKLEELHQSSDTRENTEFPAHLLEKLRSLKEKAILSDKKLSLLEECVYEKIFQHQAKAFKILNICNNGGYWFGQAKTLFLENSANKDLTKIISKLEEFSKNIEEGKIDNSGIKDALKVARDSVRICPVAEGKLENAYQYFGKYSAKKEDLFKAPNMIKRVKQILNKLRSLDARNNQ